MKEAEQDATFTEAMVRFGGGIGRIVRAYEADASLRPDLEQDIQVALWRSLSKFEGHCSLSTWVWRVAHNRATTHMLQHQRRRTRNWTSIEKLEIATAEPSPYDLVESDQARSLMLDIINHLDPPDRQIMLLYLEGVVGVEIAEITGVSSDAVATKIHRFKAMLTRRFAKQGEDG